MREAQTIAVPVGAHLQQLGVLGVLDGRHQRVRVQLDDVAEQREVDTAANDRGHVEHRAGVVAQAGQAMPEDQADGVGHRPTHRGGIGADQALVLEQQRPIGQMPEQLLDEEGVPGGLGEHRIGQILRRRLVRQRLQHRRDRWRRQRVQPQLVPDVQALQPLP